MWASHIEMARSAIKVVVFCNTVRVDAWLTYSFPLLLDLINILTKVNYTKYDIVAAIFLDNIIITFP